MIREHHHPVPEESTVSLPSVVPWTRLPSCPKCGGSLGNGLWIVGLILASLGRSSQNYAYCRGDCNSTVQMPGLNIATGEMGPMEMKTACFGVFHEHLHLACGRCRFAWLMATKGGK